MQRVYQRLFPGPVRKRLLSRQWFHQASNYEGLGDILDDVEIRSASEFADFFYSYHAFVMKGKLRGVKSDDCWQYLDTIGDVIPNRKYIFLARDPRDNLLSIINKDFGPRTIYTAAQFVNHQLELYLGEMDRRPNDSMMTQYEVLLEQPEEFVNAFAEFADLEIPADVDQALDELKIRRANSRKWTEWSGREIDVAEAVLGKHFNRLGYERHGKSTLSLTSSEIASFRIKDVLLRVPQRLQSVWDHKILAK